jgi:hypothetical protein
MYCEIRSLVFPRKAYHSNKRWARSIPEIRLTYSKAKQCVETLEGGKYCL